MKLKLKLKFQEFSPPFKEIHGDCKGSFQDVPQRKVRNPRFLTRPNDCPKKKKKKKRIPMVPTSSPRHHKNPNPLLKPGQRARTKNQDFRRISYLGGGLGERKEEGAKQLQISFEKYIFTSRDAQARATTLTDWRAAGYEPS